MSVNSNGTNRLLQAAAAGDQRAWDALLSRHRQRLRRMVTLRTDQRLQGQIDPADVFRRASLEAAVRLPQYLRKPTLPFFLWLRSIAGETLSAQHRQRLGSSFSDPYESITLFRGTFPAAITATLAQWLIGYRTLPPEQFTRSQEKIHLQQAVNSLDQLDREILLLRHFEQLSNVETAQVLDIDPSEASRRYIRALKRLKDVLALRSDKLSAVSDVSPTSSLGVWPAATTGNGTSRSSAQPESRHGRSLRMVLLTVVVVAVLATIAVVLGR